MLEKSPKSLLNCMRIENNDAQTQRMIQLSLVVYRVMAQDNWSRDPGLDPHWVVVYVSLHQQNIAFIMPSKFTVVFIVLVINEVSMSLRIHANSSDSPHPLHSLNEPEHPRNLLRFTPPPPHTHAYTQRTL